MPGAYAYAATRSHDFLWAAEMVPGVYRMSRATALGDRSSYPGMRKPTDSKGNVRASRIGMETEVYMIIHAIYETDLLISTIKDAPPKAS